MTWPRSSSRGTGPASRSFFALTVPLLFIALLTLSAVGANAQGPADGRRSSRTAPAQDPISHWKLDETSGTTAADDAGSNNGTLVNGPVWRPTGGWIGGALEFDGVNDYVDLGTMDVPAVAGLSIAFWFKADDFDVTDARFISKASGSSGSDHYWMVSTYNSTALRFRLKTAGVTTTLISDPGEIEPGIWYHIAATYDGSKMRIYKNGVEVAISDKTGAVDTNAAVGAALGNQPGSVDRHFDGLLDDVRIYDRGLSPSEVGGLASAGVIESDDFHSTTLDTTRWRVDDPVGDVTFLMSGTNLVVGVPGGTKHSLSSSGILAPRLL
ncbi:MAG: LamG domain-containing protein, partial [bacterium]